MALVTPFHSFERYTCPAGALAETLIDSLGDVLDLDQKLHASGNTVYKEEELYEAEVLPQVQLWQMLYEARDDLPRDLQSLLQLAIDRSITAPLANAEGARRVGELGPWHHQRGRELNDHEGWVSLIRSCLGSFTGPVEEFFEACQEAFPGFVFSAGFPKCLGTFDGELTDFVPEVVSALVSLADDMPNCMNQPSTKDALKAFSAVSGYETSMEGDAGRKDALTFRFTRKDGTKADILCEPHIKLHASGRRGDGKHYFHRIYFSSRNHVEFPDKTLIGHIGEHL